MIKILIVEDDPARIKWFKKKLEPFSELEMFTDAAPAIEKLKNEKYDVIFLDHDLDFKVYVPSECENTGFQVAKIIPQTINKDSKIIIHSYNFDGVKNMLEVLDGLNAKAIKFADFDCVFDCGNLIVKEIYW